MKGNNTFNGWRQRGPDARLARRLRRIFREVAYGDDVITRAQRVHIVCNTWNQGNQPMRMISEYYLAPKFVGERTRSKAGRARRDEQGEKADAPHDAALARCCAVF